MSKWIQSAIKHPGSFTKSAKKAGKSVGAFAEEHKHDSGKTGSRARLAITLRGMSHKKNASKEHPGKHLK
jgi:hypothetical protein